MSTHRRTTKIDRLNVGAKKAGRGFLKGAEIALEVTYRVALRADADRKQAEADEANRKVWAGEHEAGFFGGLLDTWAKRDEADEARARYRNHVVKAAS